MKKSLLLIITLFCFLSTIFSQINETSVWHYYSEDEEGLQPTWIVNIEKDTVIDGKTYYIFNGSCGCEFLPEHIVRSEDDKMYYYYKNQEHLLYDFSMEVGDTMAVYWPASEFDPRSTEMESDSIYYVVESITNEVFREGDIKVFQTKGLWGEPEETTNRYVFFDKIYDGLGGGCLFPQVVSGDGCEGVLGPILCYEQDSMIYHLNSSNCEASGVEGAVVYLPFVDDRALWIINQFAMTSPQVKSYKAAFSVDSFFYGNHYYRHLAKTDMIDGVFDFSEGVPMREEDRKVYRYKDDKDLLIFDFNLNEGDSFVAEENIGLDQGEADIVKVDTVLMQNSRFRRKYHLECDGSGAGEMIEGIGVLHQFYETEYLCATDIGDVISCYYYDGLKEYSFREDQRCWIDTGVDDENITYSIHPNPVLDYLTIQDLKFERYEVYDITGVKVLTGGQVENVDFRSLPRGIFFINLINHDRKNVVTRVVKL